MILDTDWTPLIAFLALIAAGILIMRGIRTFNHVEQPPRAYKVDGNYWQPTDNWFDPVANYFGRRIERDERFARALDKTCFTDDKKRTGGVHAPRPTSPGGNPDAE